MDTGLALIYGIDISGELIFKPIVQLAAHDRSIFVVDGENSFRSYRIARYAREMKLDSRTVLSNVRVSRAFTCYQLTELIVKLSRLNIDHCAGIICLGLLGTFYDEDVTLAEARRLLHEAIVQLKSLAEQVPVLITVRPPSVKVKDRLSLVNMLMQHVDEVRVLPSAERPSSQLQLQLNAGRIDGPHQ